MKNALKKWFTAFQNWTAAADAEFAAKDDTEKQIFLEILNDWR